MNRKPYIIPSKTNNKNMERYLQKKLSEVGEGGGDGSGGKSPYVGENGHWFEWNVEQQQFVDTGVSAQGPEGKRGPQGIQGNTGSNVDYPFELVNNRTTNDPEKGLSAAEGYRIGEDISQLEAKVTDLTDPDYEGTGTREVNKADYLDGVTRTVNGVSIVCNADGTFEFSETATSGGGRGTKLTSVFTLPAGTYTLRATTISGSVFPTIYLLKNDGSDTIIKSFTNSGEVAVTIANDTTAFIGANVTNGTAYSGKCRLEVISIETYTKKSAEDDVARNNLLKLSTYEDISAITDITNHYVSYSTGELVSSSGWDAYRFRPVVGSKIKAFVGINLSTWAAIAFYCRTTPTTASYLGGVQGIIGSNSYEATVPNGAVLAVVCNRRATEANPTISAYIENITEIVKTINENSVNLDKLTGNVEKVFSSFGHSVGRVVDDVYSDMTWVGDKLVCFNSSNDDLQTEPGRIAVYTFGNGKDKPYTDKNFGYHTLGHCNTIDYCEETDCLILGNGSGSYNLSGKIIIIPGFSSLIGNVYSDYPSTNPLGITNSGAIVIDCASYNLGTKFNVLWGENNGLKYNIAYLITAKTGGSTSDPAGGDNGTIRRIVLGMGSNSLQYGQFISGKADDEFNGTFAITDTYTQPETNYTNGCNQGTCYHNGRIISAVNHDGLNIWAMRLDDGKIYRNVYNQKTFGADGTETKNNISGICVKDERMYVGGQNLGILCYDGIVD